MPRRSPGPNLGSVLRQLAESEINYSIDFLYDRGWTVRLGDALNGFEAEETFDSDDFGEIATWLIAVACTRRPGSKFAAAYAGLPANDA